MKKYRSIDLDYGVNTALIEAYRQLQREMELEDDEDDMEDIVPAMGTANDLAAAEEFAAEMEFGGDLEIVEYEE